MIWYHFLWKVNESFLIKNRIKKGVGLEFVGYLPPQGGGVGDSVMLDKEPKLLECFFFMKENRPGDILGNKIYPTLASDVFSSPVFVSLLFCSVAENPWNLCSLQNRLEGQRALRGTVCSSNSPVQ